MTSYASTGPFEHLLAEGHVFRQASERPRSLVVVLGIWLIFGTMALTGSAVALMGREMGIGYMALGAIMVAISVLLIAKTTRNYLARGKTDEKRDG